MSSITFQFEKTILEKELSIYKQFLETKLNYYNIERPNEESMKQYADSIKEKINTDIGKSFEEFFMFIVVPEWKVMFECDNFIDTGKTLEQQKDILFALIESLKTSKRIEEPFMTEEVRHTVNTKFLYDDYKYCILLELLQAEYRLCFSDIHWIDALLDRVRVMFYSGLFVGDLEKVEDTIEMINSKTFKTSFPPRLIAVFKQLTSIASFDEKVTLFDLLGFLVFLSVGCGISDDFMDIEEDTLNNKITGVTQCTIQGVDVKNVLSSTIEYLRERVMPNEYCQKAKEWFLDLMSLMYVDLSACLKLCKDISPYGYEIVFQRKS